MTEANYEAAPLATAEAASGAGEWEELAAFGASEAAGYQYPGADQAAERAAFCAGAAHAASLPPATDPAISGLSSFPPNWKLRQMHFSAPCADDRKWHVNVYGGREGGDTFVGRGTSADEALRDAARNACTALAAAPTIPATDGVLASNDGIRFSDVVEHFQETGGLEKVGFRPATGEAEAEIADLKQSVIAFCAPAAMKYAQDLGWPLGHLHPTHYDLLERCGGRMDDFVRASTGHAATEGEGA